MKTLVLTGNREILVGLRMAGFEGVFCGDDATLRREYKKARERDDIGILVIPESEYEKCRQEGVRTKSWKKLPLVVSIPEGTGFRDKDFLMRRVKEAIGVSVD